MVTSWKIFCPKVPPFVKLRNVTGDVQTIAVALKIFPDHFNLICCAPLSTLYTIFHNCYSFLCRLCATANCSTPIWSVVLDFRHSTSILLSFPVWASPHQTTTTCQHDSECWVPAAFATNVKKCFIFFPFYNIVGPLFFLFVFLIKIQQFLFVYYL